MGEKQVTYLDLIYTLDDKTGYYLNSTYRKRLHRSVWESHNGEIPQGFHIHHIDGNKFNNDITNLELLSSSEHLTYHGKHESNMEKMKKFQEAGIKKAVEWHGSEAGLEWHKGHYEKNKEKLHQKKEFKCENCGSSFEAVINGHNRFCSNSCKSAWRRKNGLDNEERSCIQCGNKFSTNKYKKAKYCSVACSNKNVVRRRKAEETDTL